MQYRDNRCPKLFTSAQAAFPFHSGGVRYRLYYGDPSITEGRGASGLRVMYLTITDGAIAPISATAVLTNP